MSVSADVPGPTDSAPYRAPRDGALPITDKAIRVLIIDDHPIVRQGLTQLFEGAPDVQIGGTAATFAEAMDLLAANVANIAIVDLSLSDGSGMDILAAIRDHHPTTKAIVFSIHDPEIYAPRALRAGASGFVCKTQPCEDLVAAVRALSQGEIYLSEDAAQRMLRRMRSGSHNPLDGDVEQLSDRELQVFEMIGNGRSTSDIARALHLSPKTVETHRKRIKTKLGIETGAKLLIRASQWVATNA